MAKMLVICITGACMIVKLQSDNYLFIKESRRILSTFLLFGGNTLLLLKVGWRNNCTLLSNFVTLIEFWDIMIYKNIIRLGVKHSFGLPSNSRNSQINLALAPSFQKRFVTGKIYYDPIGYIRSRIGDRDMVGYGVNGKPEYVDRPDFPFPSILYKETTPDVQVRPQGFCCCQFLKKNTIARPWSRKKEATGDCYR